MNALEKLLEKIYGSRFCELTLLLFTVLWLAGTGVVVNNLLC